jgi:hypothetical protein
LVGKPGGKRPVGRLWHRNDVREIGHENVDWINLSQNREQWWTVINTVMNLHIL